MQGGWSDQLLRPGAATIGIIIGASSLLLAQVVERDQAAPGPNQQASAAATQPSAMLSAAEGPATDSVASAARRLTPGEPLRSGLIGSKHDFSGRGKPGRDLCRPCHAPHLLNVPPPRPGRRPTTTRPLRPYKELGVELHRWSLLCLGCHDGLVAPDVYSYSHATTVSSQLANSRLGTAGLRSHPVGNRYPSGEQGFHPSAAVEAAGLPLANGRVQCTTCHDPHNTSRHSGMLRISNERSRLCLTCHRL